MAILRRQKTRHDCGPTCFSNLLNLLGFNVSINRANRACNLALDGTDTNDLIRAFKRYGFTAKEKTHHSEQRAIDWLIKTTKNGTPVVVAVDSDTHWSLVLLAGQDYVQSFDPSEDFPTLETMGDFMTRWGFYSETRSTPILLGLELLPESKKAMKAIEMRAALIATSDV